MAIALAGEDENRVVSAFSSSDVDPFVHGSALAIFIGIVIVDIFWQLVQLIHAAHLDVGELLDVLRDHFGFSGEGFLHIISIIGLLGLMLFIILLKQVQKESFEGRELLIAATVVL